MDVAECRVGTKNIADMPILGGETERMAIEEELATEETPKRKSKKLD